MQPPILYYLSLINHCLSTHSLPLTTVLHSHLLKLGLLPCHTLLSNRLAHLYSRLGHLPSSLLLFHSLPSKNLHSYNTLLPSLPLPLALQLFEQIPHPNLVSYNTLLSSLSRHSRFRHALDLFSRMLAVPLAPDRFTIVAVATACTGLAAANHLKSLHAYVIVGGIDMTLIMGNVFVDGYSKCGDIELSKKVFDGMQERDVVTWTSLVGGYARGGQLAEAREVLEAMPVRNAVAWTAMVSGYEQNWEEAEAIKVFEEMVDEGVEPAASTIVSVLSACARLGLVGTGRQVHGYVIRRTTRLVNVFVDNALVDAYAKCGDMVSAVKVFDGMPERDVVSWNTMVTGFAHNGLGLQSLAVFYRMIGAGVTPTSVTFLGALSACSHAGLISEGQELLSSMEEKYGVCPRSEHYAAFVDALGRKRKLEEAVELVESLNSRSAGIWGALLGACQVHGDLELGKRAAESLFALEPDNGARYVTLSNIYAAAGKWDEAKRVRVAMKRKGLRKDAGHSWIEVRNVKHVFGAEDKSHRQNEQIYGMLHELVDQMIDDRDFLQFDN